MKHLFNSEQETYSFAKNFAQELVGGEVIGLIGDLGTGKTVFSRGLAAGLGIKNKVTSPTFVLMKVYPVNQGAIRFYCHIDAYRLKTAYDLSAIGAMEYFGRADTVTVIEWADKIKKLLPKEAKLIKFTLGESDQRLINYAF